MPDSIDSNISREEAIQQNPENIAPIQIRTALEVFSVQYIGYDEKIHQGQIVMHQSTAEDISWFFAYALQILFPINKVIPICANQYHWDDAVSCTDNNSSGYNYRFIAGTTRLSKHAQGFAFDINPRENIYVRWDKNGNEIYRLPKCGVYDRAKKGTLTKEHPLVRFMKERGWEWGGDWTKEIHGVIDYQHFEKTVR